MISVIMPLYNNEKYVLDTIQSVVNQSYIDWELIIINDASTDNSGFIVQNFLKEKKDNRIIFIDLKENKGVSFARNLGINKAHGKYISFLDSDDLWDRDFLKLTYNMMIKNNKNFVYARFAYLHDNNNIKNNTAPLCCGFLENFIHISKNRYELLLPFHIGSVLIYKDLLLKYSIFFDENQSFFEDGLFLTKILSVTDSEAIESVLMYYRQHSDSAMHKMFNSKSYLQELIFWDQLQDFVKKYNPKILSQINFVIIYRTYRIIWILIKNKYINDGLYCINKYDDRLKCFCKNPIFKINDRLKCMIFIYKCKFILELLRFF